MPHVFRVECYRKHAERGKARAGDVVYLKSRPDVPMTVKAAPAVNSAAGTVGAVETVWLKPDGTAERATFLAEELSL